MSGRASDITFTQLNQLTVTTSQGGDTLDDPRPECRRPANASLTQATFNGYSGNDTFNVSPSLTTRVMVNGGTPGYGSGGFSSTGDTLNFTAPASPSSCWPPPSARWAGRTWITWTSRTSR